MTANSKMVSRQNGYVLRCNKCKGTFRWIPGRVGDARAVARSEGWVAAKTRVEQEDSRLLASNTVRDYCGGCQ